MCRVAVYVAHSGDSPTASSTCRSGLSDGDEQPEKSEGPESKWKVPAAVLRVNSCAAPPTGSCDSHTVTE
eukprot:3144992-Prymnesium_polylepis.1